MASSIGRTFLKDVRYAVVIAMRVPIQGSITGISIIGNVTLQRSTGLTKIAVTLTHNHASARRTGHPARAKDAPRLSCPTGGFFGVGIGRGLQIARPSLF